MLNLNIVYSQNSFDYKKERHQFNIDLIKTNKKNKVIVEKITDNEEFEGKYLGEIKTSLGVEYYIVASSYVFDIKVLAKTENHIFIYNSKKQYVGYYYLSQMYELPKRLDKNKLYFNNKDVSQRYYSKPLPASPFNVNYLLD